MVRYRRRVRRRPSFKRRVRRGYRRTRRVSKFSRYRRRRRYSGRVKVRRTYRRRRKMFKKSVRSSKATGKVRKIKMSVDLSGTKPAVFPTSSELSAAGTILNQCSMSNYFGVLEVKNVKDLLFINDNKDRMVGVPDVYSTLTFGCFMFLDPVFAFRVMVKSLTTDNYGQRSNFVPSVLSNISPTDTSVRRRVIEMMLKYNYVRIAKTRYRFVRRSKLISPPAFSQVLSSSVLAPAAAPEAADYTVTKLGDAGFTVSQHARTTNYTHANTEYIRADEMFFYVCDTFEEKARDILYALQNGVNKFDKGTGNGNSPGQIDNRYVQLFTSMTKRDGLLKWQRFSTKLKSFVVERIHKMDDFDSQTLDWGNKPGENTYNLTGKFPEVRWVQATSSENWISFYNRWKVDLSTTTAVDDKSLCNSRETIVTNYAAVLPCERTFNGTSMIFCPFSMDTLTTLYDVTAEVVLEYTGKKYSIFDFNTN